MNLLFADRLKNVEEYYFSRKLEEIQVMRSKGMDVINLGIGSPDLSPPNEAKVEASQAIHSDIHHGYSSYRSTPELRLAMAKWYQETYQVNLDSKTEVLPLLGSKEGILYLSMALLNPGDQVLYPNPGYPAYASVTRLLGAIGLEYALTEKNGWLPDLDKLEKMDLSRCKLMWVNYPHMPTGTAANPELFQKLITFTKRTGILLCNDNPYGFVLNETAPLSLLSLDPTLQNCAELNSLSKSFNMAGWRVGMLLGSAPLINAVLQVKSNVDSGMFSAVQKGAIAALNVSPDWHADRNKIYKARREIVWEIFDCLGFEYARNQVGLFIWAKAPSHILKVEDFLDRVLSECHVFFTPGMIFGSGGQGYARASLCATVERLTLALARVRKWKP